MWENILKIFRSLNKKEQDDKSKKAAKERLHLVLMQDRANVSADFLELMKQEIIDVIKKYIEVDEDEIDVRLTNKTNTDGTTGAPALYANIPIMSLKSEAKKASNEVIKREEEIKKAEKEKSEQIKKNKKIAKNKLLKKEKELSNEQKVAKKKAKKSSEDGTSDEKVRKTATEATKAAFNKMASKIKSMQK